MSHPPAGGETRLEHGDVHTCVYAHAHAPHGGVLHRNSRLHFLQKILKTDEIFYF